MIKGGGVAHWVTPPPCTPTTTHPSPPPHPFPDKPPKPPTTFQAIHLPQSLVSSPVHLPISLHPHPTHLSTPSPKLDHPTHSPPLNCAKGPPPRWGGGWVRGVSRGSGFAWLNGAPEVGAMTRGAWADDLRGAGAGVPEQCSQTPLRGCTAFTGSAGPAPTREPDTATTNLMFCALL